LKSLESLNGNKIQSDIEFQKLEVEEEKRQNKIEKREAVKSRLMPIVFPCYQPSIEGTYSETNN
jgi:hypothetical protein